MKVLFRAEPNYIMAYNLTNNITMKIAGKNLALLEQWLTTDEINDFILLLNSYGLIHIPVTEEEKEELKCVINCCYEIKTPQRAMSSPEIMNIELTTRCPLRCTQCYCDLNQGKDIKREIAIQYIEQAARLKIPFINLSGGETLVYPYLTELLRLINFKGLKSAIAISGWGFDSAKLETLKKSGVDEIYVSLNGSTAEINIKSRDGYEHAITALKLLQADQQINYYINWVARNDNTADFPNLVNLAQAFKVKGIIILESKPDADHMLQASLSPNNFRFLADYLKKHNQQEISIEVEPCFSPLKAYINNYYFYNCNTGINKGCGAGRNAMAVDVDGNLIPCRHLLYPETYENIEDYWWNSEVLDKLRTFEDKREEPCRSCKFNNNCLSCRAIADKVENNILSSNNYCVIGGMEF